VGPETIGRQRSVLLVGPKVGIEGAPSLVGRRVQEREIGGEGARLPQHRLQVRPVPPGGASGYILTRVAHHGRQIQGAGAGQWHRRGLQQQEGDSRRDGDRGQRVLGLRRGRRGRRAVRHRAPQLLLAPLVPPIVQILGIAHWYLLTLIAGKLDSASHFRSHWPFITAFPQQRIYCLDLVPTCKRELLVTWLIPPKKALARQTLPKRIYF